MSALLQDEVGSTAVFATQLDEFLGGGAVQHRQVQGAEDEEFSKVIGSWEDWVCHNFRL